METMQPVLKAGRDVWDKINMPETEFQGRVKRIQKEMQKRGADIAFIYGNGINEYGNPCYISNYSMQIQRGALVAIPATGDIALIYEGSSRDLPDTRLTTWVEDIRPCENIAKECAKYLEEKNLMTSTIGLAGLKQLMPYSQLQSFYKSIERCKTVDFNNVIKNLRMAKSARECDQIRRASRILRRSFEFLSSGHFSDMNERIVEATLNREMRLEGAEDCRVLAAKPMSGNWSLRPVRDVQISPGESIIIYLAAGFERYWAEGIRTFMAEPSRFTNLRDESNGTLYEKITEMIKPGIKASELYQRITGALRKRNIDYIAEYGPGHGIGLSLQEPPIISGEDLTMLREGMCLALRLAIKDKDAGAIMMGNTVHLLKDGVETFTY